MKYEIRACREVIAAENFSVSSHIESNIPELNNVPDSEAEFWTVYEYKGWTEEWQAMYNFADRQSAEKFINERGLKSLNINEIETFADVADVVFTEVRKQNGKRDFNSRDIPELIHRLACKFEEIYKDKDWSEDDYLGTVEDWTEAHAAEGLKDLAIK
jgi:hypothetical protein